MTMNAIPGDTSGVMALVAAASSDLGEVPQVLPQYEACWSRVEVEPETRIGNRMKAALRLVCAGFTYRQAAERLRYSDHANVWRAAKQYGVCEARTEEIIAGSRRISKLAGDTLEARLVEDPDAISTRDLIVARGVENDKLARYERWGQQAQDNSALSAFDRAVAAALEGGKVAIEVKVTPIASREHALDHAIDITPTAALDPGRLPEQTIAVTPVKQ